MPPTRTPPGGRHQPRLLAAVEPRIREVIEREGVFRDPKGTACFVASVW